MIEDVRCFQFWDQVCYCSDSFVDASAGALVRLVSSVIFAGSACNLRRLPMGDCVCAWGKVKSAWVLVKNLWYEESPKPWHGHAWTFSRETLRWLVHIHSQWRVAATSWRAYICDLLKKIIKKHNEGWVDRYDKWRGGFLNASSVCWLLSYQATMPIARLAEDRQKRNKYLQQKVLETLALAPPDQPALLKVIHFLIFICTIQSCIFTFICQI